MWYSSSNTIQILQLELLDQSVEIQSTLTIASDLIATAVSCQHEVPLHLKRITDLRHIESQINDIVHFEPNFTYQVMQLFSSLPISTTNLNEAKFMIFVYCIRLNNIQMYVGPPV